MVLRRGVLPQCPRAVEGAENATAGAKRFQPKAERNLPAEIYGPERPAASPGLQPCAVLRVVTRSRRLCGNLGVRARASQPGARQWLGDGSGPKDGPPVAGASRSVRGRLASGLRRLWSVAGGSRPTPLPSPMRQPCCRGRCSSRWGVRLPLPPSAAIARAGPWHCLRHRKAGISSANRILQCLPPLSEPGSTTQRGTHRWVV